MGRLASLARANVLQQDQGKGMQPLHSSLLEPDQGVAINHCPGHARCSWLRGAECCAVALASDGDSNDTIDMQARLQAGGCCTAQCGAFSLSWPRCCRLGIAAPSAQASFMATYASHFGIDTELRVCRLGAAALRRQPHLSPAAGRRLQPCGRGDLAAQQAAETNLCAGWGLLHYAVEGGDIVILGALLQAGHCSPVDADGTFSPLHLAAQGGRSELVTMLVDAGCAASPRQLACWLYLDSCAQALCLDSSSLLPLGASPCIAEWAASAECCLQLIHCSCSKA